jgi:hypothetical protein
MRQHHGQTLVLIALPEAPRRFELFAQVRQDRTWHRYHPVFAAFGGANDQLPRWQVNILDAQVQRFAHPQAAPI